METVEQELLSIADRTLKAEFPKVGKLKKTNKSIIIFLNKNLDKRTIISISKDEIDSAPLLPLLQNKLPFDMREIDVHMINKFYME